MGLMLIVDPDSRYAFLAAADNIPLCFEDKQPLGVFQNRNPLIAICTKRNMDLSIKGLHGSLLKLRDGKQEAISGDHCGTSANHPVVDQVNSEDAFEIVKDDSNDASTHKKKKIRAEPVSQFYN